MRTLDPLYENNNNDNYVYCILTRGKEKILKFETIIFGFTFFFLYHIYTRIYYMHYVIIIGTSQQRGFHSFVGPVTFLFLVLYVLTI